MPGKVLMYHALWSTESEYSRIAPEDRPYALQVETFAEQIQFISDHFDSTEVQITFDDGHVSSRRIALPVLQDAGLTATVFITTRWFGNKEDFCGPEDVEQLIQSGWTIGAHGHTHRFLTMLTDADLHLELEASAGILGQWLADVPSMSFPGGRYGKREIEAARQHGYVDLFGSRPAARNPGGEVVIPRFAIRGSTDIQSFRKMMYPSAISTVKNLAAYYSKRSIRRLLGDNNYHNAYRILKG